MARRLETIDRAPARLNSPHFGALIIGAAAQLGASASRGEDAPYVSRWRMRVPLAQAACSRRLRP